MAKKKKVGDEIEAYCSKCKMDTVHVVTAMKDDAVNKVICKACDSTHKYKPAGGESSKKSVSKSTPKTQKRKKKTKEERSWNRAMAKADPENPVDYAMSGSFSESDVIQHDAFGLGVVTKVVSDQKINVAFQDGARTLVQNY
jgi:hypothetical protein